MIDFQNATFVKLRRVSDDQFAQHISALLVNGEQVVGTFQGIRDGVVFTNKRILAINIQGITGKKKDFTTLPYNKIQAFSIETAGVFDLDGELELWFSGLGKVRFEFTGNANLSELAQVIGSSIL